MNVDFDNQDIIIELAPEGKDGRSVHPAGEWSADAEYHSLDLVSYQGSSYIAERSVPAGTLPTDSEYWQVVAEKGEPGASEWGEIAGNIADQTDLANALDSKADASDVADALAEKANVGDSYTKSEENALLADKADADDLGTMSAKDADDYYTKSETDTLLQDKAPVILNSASGSIASFTDGSPAPVTALTVGIEPVQDLHGYDNPWPAGGGKNICNPTAAVDGTYDANNGKWLTRSMGSYALSRLAFTQITTTATTYTLSFKARISSGSGIINLVNLQDSNNQTPSTSTRTEISKPTLTSTYNTYVMRFDYSAETTIERIVVQSSANASDLVIDITEIQLELGSSATSFAPYSNICPISGHTSAVVTRTGKNLLPKGQSIVKTGITFTVNADGTVTVTGSDTTTRFWGVQFTIPAGTYILNGCPSGGGNSSYMIDVRNAVGGAGISGISSDIGSGSTFTITKSLTAYVNIRIAGGYTIPTGGIKLSPMIRLASDTDATYEPYQGQQVAIDLGGTRYGSVLDVLTGEMTVTKAIVKTSTSYSSFSNLTALNDGSGYYVVYSNCFPTSMSGKTIICDSYNKPSSLPGGSWENLSFGQFYAPLQHLLVTVPNDANTISLAREYLRNLDATFVYPLATPVTVQLTPAQMQTLLGQNHLWADTGDTSVEYRADTKLYIDGKFSQLQALILEN